MKRTPMRKLLIANRGEIACRIIRTARAMGIKTVAVYSEADAQARHVQLADEALCIGASAATASYLNASAVLAACARSGADAVHPGYGFLSESSAFAQAVQDAGLIFVGPDPHSIQALGNKSAGKQLANSIGVSCLPGYNGADQSITRLMSEAQTIGAPLMIKAASGGGGRGMRRIDQLDPIPLQQALESAASEARASFGDSTLLLERLVEHARHVEIQVFGDRHGDVIYLGERDCSTQRRHQKVIEEAPAPGLSDDTRRAMGEAAVQLARAVHYVGAGTIEFLVAQDQSFYFLEMNTRLQVEHPVTEAITGLDLVRWQLLVAQGEPLPLRQNDIRSIGHAIEVRLCAEDAYAEFMPQAGSISYWGADALARFDHGLSEKAEVPAYYDSMIGKLIVHGHTRNEALNKIECALLNTTVLGLATNRDFLLQCIRDPAFQQAESLNAPSPLCTGWLSAAMPHWQRPQPSSAWLAIAAALHLYLNIETRFGALNFFSSTGAQWNTWPLQYRDQRMDARVKAQHQSSSEITIDVSIHLKSTVFEHQVAFERFSSATERHTLVANIDGLSTPITFSVAGLMLWLDGLGMIDQVQLLRGEPPQRRDTSQQHAITSNMHGLVTRVLVSAGQSVKAGELLLCIEAMKMEHRIEAPRDTIIAEVLVNPGQQVAPQHALVNFSAATQV
jgi:geranyl-CoA carboxylase alpha subunit